VEQGLPLRDGRIVVSDGAVGSPTTHLDVVAVKLDELRELREKATRMAPEPWSVHPKKPSMILTGAEWTSMAVGSPEVARLIALAPDLARLVEELGGALETVVKDAEGPVKMHPHTLMECRAALASLAEVKER
jgi:hypothetical protein